MANKLEKIADKKKKAAVAKQEADVARFAKQVADEVLGGLGENKTSDLKDSVAELATSVAQAVVASNKTFDTELKDNFTQLLAAVKNNRPDNTSLTKLNKEIGKSLAKFEGALDRLELSPEITVAGLTQDQLKTEVDKVLARMPKSSQREVSLAYEKATADKYINVRLTDGIKFYSAFSSGSGSGSREGGATAAKQDSIIAAVVASQKTEWGLNDKENTGTYLYYGQESAAGAWKIIRKTIATNVFRYATGASGYNAAWTARASQTYDTYGNTF